MSSTRSLQITLPAELADKVEARVASGAYPSESAVVEDGLDALFAEDGAIETWLRDAVLPTLAEVETGVMPMRSAQETRDRLHARIDRLIEENG